MSNSILSRLGKLNPQPKGGSAMSQSVKQRKAAPPLEDYVLYSQEDMTVGEILPPGLFNDSVSNHIVTVLGAGQGGKSGLNLWFTASRKVCRTQDNAKLILACMTDPQIATFCSEHNLADVDELLLKISELPLVADELPDSVDED